MAQVDTPSSETADASQPAVRPKARVAKADVRDPARVPAPSVAEPQTGTVDPTLVDRIPWLNELIDKEYRLYSWNDARVQTLATINGLLIAALSFLFRDGSKNYPSLLFLSASMLLLCAGLGVCLWFLRRFPHSNKTTEDNPNVRSLRGISSHENWKHYEEVLRTMPAEQFFQDSARQIFGMAHNNLVFHRMMERGAWLTLVGAAFLILAAGAQTFLPAQPNPGGGSSTGKGDATQSAATPTEVPGGSGRRDQSRVAKTKQSSSK